MEGEGLMMNNKFCRICNRPLTFDKGRGWVHPGGSTYVMRCKHCGHESDLITETREVHCPKCGSPDWVDDHCVQAW